MRGRGRACRVSESRNRTSAPGAGGSLRAGSAPAARHARKRPADRDLLGAVERSGIRKGERVAAFGGRLLRTIKAAVYIRPVRHEGRHHAQEVFVRVGVDRARSAPLDAAVAGAELGRRAAELDAQVIAAGALLGFEAADEFPKLLPACE